MTATWTTIPDANLEPAAPARSVDALALRDNPIAIAERASGAPVVQVPVIDTKTTGTAATWTWPADVTAVTVTIVGGGGGTDSVAQNGGDSSITYNSVTYTGGGGTGGTGAVAGAGGTATGGDVNVPGQPAVVTGLIGGSSGMGLGHGGVAATNGSGYGGGSGPNTGAGYNPGGGGGTVKKRIAKVVGLETITYTVGAGGNGAYDGAAGAVIFEY